MKRRLILILVLAMVASLFAACSGGSTTVAPTTSSPTSQAGETTTVTTTAAPLINLPTSGQNVVQTAVTLVAGEKLGTWANLGLNVTRTHYVSGPPQLEANPAGDWDIGWMGATAVINGTLNYDMIIVGLSGYDYSNMGFARADDTIVAEIGRAHV